MGDDYDKDLDKVVNLSDPAYLATLEPLPGPEGFEAEALRMARVAAPELLEIPWFEKVGQPSELSQHCGRQLLEAREAFVVHGREILEAEAPFADIAAAMEVRIWAVTELFFHVERWRKSDPTLSRRPEVEWDMPDYFLLLQDDIFKRVVERGAQHPWWTRDIKRLVFCDVRHYAIWRAFEETDGLGVSERYPDFFPRAMEIYRGGHIPTGWSAAPDGHRSELGQGNFIYQ